MSVLSQLSNALRVGFIWSVLWALSALIAGTLLGFFDGREIAAGEEPWRMAPMIGLVGFVCGVFFSLLFGLTERTSETAAVRRLRLVVCGAIAAGVVPLLAGQGLPEMVVMVPLGIGSAIAAVTLVGRWNAQPAT